MSESTKNLHLVGYARISDDDQHQGRGVERQRQDIKAEAKTLGAILVKVDGQDVIMENDRGASIKSTKKRPEYDRVVAMLRTREVDGVIAYSLERLTRRFDQGHELLKLGMAGLHIIGLTEEIDLATPRGQERYGDILNDAHRESMKISRRVKRSQAQAREDGRRHCGRRRGYGYTRDMVVIEEEAAIIRATAAMIRDGMSGNAVAKWAAAQGARTTEGNPWTSKTPKQVLTNPVISGRQVYKGEAIALETEPWPAIITPDEQAVLLMAFARMSQPDRRTNGNPTAFSGLLRCAECDGRILHRAVTNYPMWKCRGGCGMSVSAKVENYILDEFFRAVPAVRVARNREDDVATRSIDAIQDDVAALLDVRKLIGPDQFRRRREALEAEMREAQQRHIGPSVADRLLYGTENLKALWDQEDGLPVDVKRQLLRSVFDAVYIKRATRRVTWSDQVAEERVVFYKAGTLRGPDKP